MTRRSFLPEYTPWRSMIVRCTDPKYRQFHLYGGAGVTICPEWRNSFEAFRDHIGPRPSMDHSIDRIDNAKGYHPGNVRWATRVEQQRNKTNNVNVTIDGMTKCVAEWCVIYGVAHSTVSNRIARGWGLVDAISTRSEPSKRISPKDRLLIVKAYSSGTETHRSLAKKFNTSKNTIEKILKEVA